jgi:N-acetylmuramoyl-L-alanine amidase
MVLRTLPLTGLLPAIPSLSLVLLLVVWPRPATAQRVTGDSSLFIRLVYPETDTTVVFSAGYRLSASTNPLNRVTVNGKSVRVYPSGAFVSLLPLERGENRFTVVATRPDSNSVQVSFLLVRPLPLAPTPSDTLHIEDTLMEPAADAWLNDGDLLEVQFKGTPGYSASFLTGVPMHQVSPSRTGGVEGVYRGIYRVTASDTSRDMRIPFRLARNDSQAIVKESAARISFKARDFPLVGVTKGDRVYLDFGLADDRLGGAKLSFIEPGIRVAITGKVAGRYRVALAENQEAWIPVEQVELLPPGERLPYSLTGNWSVYGDSMYDYVTLALEDRLPYSTFQEVSPTRIHIDLYGAVSNSNWITQQLTTREIKNAYYAQVSKNQFRLTIELQHRQVWGYNIRYRGNTLVIRIRRQPESLKLNAMTVVLDAGHGGANRGALGSTGALEKDVALALVQHLKTVLESRGASVRLTRWTDEDIPTLTRLNTIWNSGADLLVSVHANSVSLGANPEDIKGVSTYYKHLCYRPLSLHILERVLETGLSSFGNVGGFNFSLNSVTEMPNVLIETAFISNPEDEMRLLDEELREEIAERIADGIGDFLEECEEDEE